MDGALESAEEVGFRDWLPRPLGLACLRLA